MKMYDYDDLKALSDEKLDELFKGLDKTSFVYELYYKIFKDEYKRRGKEMP